MAMDYNFKLLSKSEENLKKIGAIDYPFGFVVLKMPSGIFIQSPIRMVISDGANTIYPEPRITFQKRRTPGRHFGAPAKARWEFMMWSPFKILKSKCPKISVYIYNDVYLKMVFVFKDEGLWANMHLETEDGQLIKDSKQTQLVIDAVSFNLLKHRINQEEKETSNDLGL